jgi:hypothetical protein
LRAYHRRWRGDGRGGGTFHVGEPVGIARDGHEEFPAFLFCRGVKAFDFRFADRATRLFCFVEIVVVAHCSSFLPPLRLCRNPFFHWRKIAFAKRPRISFLCAPESFLTHFFPIQKQRPMKKHISIVALAATAALLSSGCVTEVKVESPNAPKAEWVKFFSGELIVRYPGRTQKELFDATNKALDQYLGGNRRVGENWPADNPALPPSYEIFARTEGDIKISVLITTESATATSETTEAGEAGAEKKAKSDEPKEWTQVVISYGAFGNLPESQSIEKFITKNLR